MRRPAEAAHARLAARAGLGCLLALAAALLVGCGSSARGLIPSGEAGPLLGDFEAVQHAAESGGGDCAATNQAIGKTEHDFAALSSSVDAELRANLRHGVENLGARARELCAQPLTSTTTTSTTQAAPPKTSTTPTTTGPAPVAPAEVPEGTEAEKSTGPGGAPGEESSHEKGGSEATETTGGTEGAVKEGGG